MATDFSICQPPPVKSHVAFLVPLTAYIHRYHHSHSVYNCYSTRDFQLHFTIRISRHNTQSQNGKTDDRGGELIDRTRIDFRSVGPWECCSLGSIDLRISKRTCCRQIQSSGHSAIPSVQIPVFVASPTRLAKLLVQYSAKRTQHRNYDTHSLRNCSTFESRSGICPTFLSHWSLLLPCSPTSFND